MKKISILLIYSFLFFDVSGQKEYVYRNAEYGVEITFPFEPKVSNKGNYVSFVSATLNIFSSYGLSYSIVIQKNEFGTTTSEMSESSEKMFKSKSKINYQVGKIDVVENEVNMLGVYSRSKIICLKKYVINIYVQAKSWPKDKDVFPFFNSLKIDGVLIQNPTIDNSKYKNYALESLIKRDTVYINSDSKISYHYEKFSDVDQNIPQNTLSNTTCFALIVGNEDYSSQQADLKSESNVEFARNDASAFKEYCTNTLGVPEKNITFLLDATVGQINQGISKLKLLAKASGGKAQLIVFYAGHGLPDETTKEPYLIPVDVSGANVTSGIKLQDLYSNLTEFPSERVTVYLDACFTGGGRSAGLIASRGVKVRPKEGVLKGNIVVFSSSSGEQSSLPYADQKHGMFTYFLLKKLQETKGDVTYSDLSTFLQEKISVESILVNSKEQNPVVNTGQDIADKWKQWRLR